MQTKSKSILVLGALLSFTVAATCGEVDDDRNHKKRQIYREQVLPHAGGRIPDTAFETDRLFLNRLQKDGIAIPDGIVLEQRNPQVHPFYNKNSRPVFHIALSSDGRFTPKEGQYHHNEVPSVETTYLVPDVVGKKITLSPTNPAYPIYRQLQLHSPHLNQVKFQPRKKVQLLNYASTAGKGYLKSEKTTSYQNFNIINDPFHVPPVKPAIKLPADFYGNANFVSNFKANGLFNEFNTLFNNFDLFNSRPDANTYYGGEHTVDLPISGFGVEHEPLIY